MNIYGATWVSGYRGSGIYLDGGTDSYLIANPFNGFPSDTITALFWMETNDTTDTGVPISYASSSTPDDFALMNYQNLRIYVAGNYRIPGLAFNDGVWHGIAATWRSTDGNVEIFDNSSLAYTNTLSEGNTITDGGSFVVGQDQDSVGGGFDASQAFIGTIDEILLFSSVLTASQVQDIYDENYFVIGGGAKLMVRGFTNVISNLIFFIGALIAVALAVSAITVMLQNVQTAMEQKAAQTVNKTETIIDIVDGGADGNYLWVYVKNTGRTNLDVNSMDLFIDGKYVGSCNDGTVVCTDTSGDYVLGPTELLDVNTPWPYASGSWSVKVVAGNGVATDPYTVVVP